MELFGWHRDVSVLVGSVFYAGTCAGPSFWPGKHPVGWPLCTVAPKETHTEV